MSAITSGNFPKALWPGLNKLWGESYNDHPLECEQVFDVSTSSKSYEEDVEVPGFGLAPVKSEGTAIQYDAHTQGPTTRYINVTYGMGFIVTEEEMEDNLYRSRAFRRTKMLARSMKQTKEVVCANILNRAFNSSYTGGDGKELLATDHPTVDGTQSNELSVAADMSEASIEDLGIQIMNATDTRGLRIALMPKKLIVPPNLFYEATRIVKSELQNDTANNAVNAIRNSGMFRDGVMVYHYLTDTDAWFVKTDAPDSLRLFNRRAIAFAQDKDFDTSNLKYKATERFVPGWSEWRGLYGSPGA